MEVFLCLSSYCVLNLRRKVDTKRKKRLEDLPTSDPFIFLIENDNYTPGLTACFFGGCLYDFE